MASTKTDAVRYGRKIELRGQRPAPLMIQNESQKIRKSRRKPVIIYMVSPKAIHAEPSEFMDLVQRLTGLASSPPAPPAINGKSPGSNQSSTGLGDVVNRRKFPVKVKARVLQPHGLERDQSPQQPILPTLSSGGDQKGGFMDSQNWFLWENY